MGSLIAYLYALLAQFSAIPVSLELQNQALETTIQVAAAQEEQQILPAAQAYIQQNLSTIESTATATSPVVISISQLTSANIGANGLPASFSSMNPYGQTWQVQVLQPSAGNLQALLIGVGGTRKLLDREGAAIAAQVGIAGGFVPQNDSGIYPATTHVYGNAANYNIATAGYQNITGGQPAALLVLNNGQQQNLYLYRVAVPGQHQLNTMFTGLDMGGNAITNANGVQTAGGSNAASYQVGSVWYYGDSSGNAAIRGNALYLQNAAGTAPMDIAEVGNITSSGSISAAGNLSITGTGSIGGNTTIGGNVQVNGNSTSNGYVVSNQDVTAGAACPTNGAMANSGTGPLFCQSGVWRSGMSAVGFGGTFTEYDTGACGAVNVVTGICSCPAGYSPNPFLGFQPGSPDFPEGATAYACVHYPN